MPQTTTLDADSSTPPGAISSVKSGHQLERNEVYQHVHDVANKLSFDSKVLTKKYHEEREKRLRYNGGLKQYQAPGGQFSYMLKDPYVKRKLKRNPIRESVEVVVIGGGYGAQLVAVELLRRNIPDIRIIEKGDDFGGTWY